MSAPVLSLAGGRRSAPDDGGEARRSGRALVDPPPGDRLRGWVATLAVTGVALTLRLVDLHRPQELVFDETYYVKQAFSMLRHGYEARWEEGADERFAVGDFGALTEAAEYVVHPPLGKWLIAAGMQLVGADSAVGWRVSSAVAGALTVLLLTRIARRLFASTLLGCTAGLLLAVDGLHLVLSRTGLLDIFLTLFVVAAFGAVVLDRERGRARLARHLARAGPGPGRQWSPGLGVRWWLVAAGVLCGLAIGVKWSGVYALAALGLLAVAWNVTARLAAGTRWPVSAGLLRDGVPAFLALVPVAALTYAATWASWFASPGAYLRQWVSENPQPHESPLPDAVASWLHFHEMVWNFHHGLSTPHGYEAGPLRWIVQARPTSFHWGTVADPLAACGADRCVEAITSVGNPVVWWAGALALVAVAAGAIRLRDWRAWTVLAGYAALWLPWFLYPERTTFTFYAVALSPFVALALTYGLALLAGAAVPGHRAVTWANPIRWAGAGAGAWAALGVVALALALAAFFWPVWTAEVIPYTHWRMRMWFRPWV